MGKDSEKGELLIDADEKLLKGLGSARLGDKVGPCVEPVVPIGGVPGQTGKFYTNLNLTLRLTTMAMLLGTLVWVPSVTESMGWERFAKHTPLAICLMIFFATPTVGGVINTASAGILGAFMACFNIFMLRGFFPDGVKPGMGHDSTESIVGWTDLALFNLIMLSGNFRPGFKITGMALNCGFMMCFLNPQDQTVFSKNFKINPNGAAVSAFLGTCMGSCCCVLALLLPYPLGWARLNMKNGAKMASEDLCKLFLSSVDYFRGEQKSILIDRQLAQAANLKAQIGGLGANIDAAYIECLDLGTEGTVRGLYEIHADMLGQLFEMLNALQIAMTTEDFGPSHKDCMEIIGEAAEDLVEKCGLLLMFCTNASDDGEIDDSEVQELQARDDLVRKALKTLSQDFDAARRKFGKPISKELMSEAFFVFSLSAFGRIVLDYSKKLQRPPKAKPLTETFQESMKAILAPPLAYHNRVVSRYWLSLLSCFAFAVFIDGYSPACAITAVFLINTRVGPDVMAMIQGLLSVVVGIVCNALMYSFSCKYGNTTSLMVVSAFYWFTTIFVAFGGSSLAGIGLIMAALAPFAILKACAVNNAAAEAASAVGLWGGIRALLIAVVVTVIWEILHVPGWFTKMATEALDKALEGVEKAFHDVFDEKDVSDSLGQVSASLADATCYNAAASMEPRFWKCRWKKEFLDETADTINKVKLDVMVMRLALLGGKGSVGDVAKYFKKVKEAQLMKEDLINTIADARHLAISLLQHDCGPFTGLEGVKDMVGIDELDGLDDAIEGFCKNMKLPGKAPDSMEEDELCQMSIILIMLEYVIAHVSEITKGAVKLA